jgi:hypothetical protein
MRLITGGVMSEGGGGPLSEPLLLPPQALSAAIRTPPVKTFQNKLAIATYHRNTWLARQPGDPGALRTNVAEEARTRSFASLAFARFAFIAMLILPLGRVLSILESTQRCPLFYWGADLEFHEINEICSVRLGSTAADSPRFGQPAPMRSIAVLKAISADPAARGQKHM